MCKQKWIWIIKLICKKIPDCCSKQFHSAFFLFYIFISVSALFICQRLLFFGIAFIFIQFIKKCSSFCMHSVFRRFILKLNLNPSQNVYVQPLRVMFSCTFYRCVQPTSKYEKKRESSNIPAKKWKVFLEWIQQWEAAKKKLECTFVCGAMHI